MAYREADGRRGRRKPIDQERAARLWADYAASPDEPTRNALVEIYLPVVGYIADRIHQKLPDEVEVDDLTSVGTFGLLDAIKNFDPARGYKFETYCAPRIRGAILDELRSMDWVPRLVRSRATLIERARRTLQMRLGMPPTDAELCDELGVELNDFEKIKRDGSPAHVSSLSRQFQGGDATRQMSEIDVLPDRRQANPFLSVQKDDLKRMITRGLTRQEKMIVMLYYYEQMTMKEIGLTLDLSESRVSQMHKSVLQRFKARFQHRGTELNESTA